MTTRDATRIGIAGAEDHPLDGPGGGTSGRRDGSRTLASALILLAVLAALAAGLWGVFSSLGSEAPPARIGERVGVSGGSLRVDAFIPEHMAHPRTGKFAASGMSMSAMGVKMTPEGKERFAVEVTLGADEGAGLSYSPEDFRVYGEGVESSAPIRHQLDAGNIPAGGAVSGVLVFQVPEDAENLMLAFDGGRPVALDGPAEKKGGHPVDAEHGH